MTSSDIDCRDLVELVTDYLEGVLSAQETKAIEAHLRSCRGCRHYLDQMRATITAVGSVPVETLSDEAVATLLSVFRR